MRIAYFALAGLLVLTGVAVATPSADAVAICIVGDIYNNWNDPCDGIVCVGHTGGSWQNCVVFKPTPPPA